LRPLLVPARFADRDFATAERRLDLARAGLRRAADFRLDDFFLVAMYSPSRV
jgi:hypothetical protein